MPTVDALPANTVRWTLDPRRAVLLVHDMQRYFLRPFPAGRSPVTELVANCSRLLAWAREQRLPVAYTAQPGGMSPADRGLLRDFWGPGMATDPEHRDVVTPLAPEPGDWLLTKWRYSAFHRSDLLRRMRAAGRTQLVCCGVYAHVGVLMTTVDALTHDIQAFLVGDAVADFSAEYHALALRYAAERSAAVTSTVGVLTAAAPVGARP
ncbi:isochorismatase family protein [Micromonospora sp. KC723]|uniref:isochorismatase family protein n=1 Tax=Micromonospora sp. KC723 TaxID=2530381 RepID=UPI0010528E34|nr:isochorismatase family protein [Micromonospora sp. KC723]TDB78119.1 isochorismatase family protein [Micromonospora sp. KC723]